MYDEVLVKFEERKLAAPGCGEREKKSYIKRKRLCCGVSNNKETKKSGRKNCRGEIYRVGNSLPLFELSPALHQTKQILSDH
jgi:hypothetical protein